MVAYNLHKLWGEVWSLKLRCVPMHGISAAAVKPKFSHQSIK